MTEVIIKINKWSETFENANSRKLKQLVFYQAPAGCNSSGFVELATEHGNDGLIALGVFSALCQLMAKQPKETRGSFLKSNGEPMSVKRLSILTHIEIDAMERSLQMLQAKGVDWISAIQIPNRSQSDPIQIPKSTARGEESTGEKSRGDNKSPTISWSRDDGWEDISDKDLKEWREAYPAVAIGRQIKVMHQWLLSNPAKAHRKQWRRFITNWLSRQQEKGGDIKSNPAGQMPILKVPDIPAKVLFTAYQKVYPVKDFPKLYPMAENKKFSDLSDEDQYRLTQAHQPLADILEINQN